MYSYRLGRAAERQNAQNQPLALCKRVRARAGDPVPPGLYRHQHREETESRVFCVPVRCLNDSGFFVDLGRGGGGRRYIDEELRLHFSASVYTRHIASLPHWTHVSGAEPRRGPDHDSRLTTHDHPTDRGPSEDPSRTTRSSTVCFHMSTKAH